MGTSNALTRFFFCIQCTEPAGRSGVGLRAVVSDTSQGVWLILWTLPALRTRAQFNSNNHLTGGSARPLHTVDKRGSDAKLGFLGKPGFFNSQIKKKGWCVQWSAKSAQLQPMALKQ